MERLLKSPWSLKQTSVHDFFPTVGKLSTENISRQCNKHRRKLVDRLGLQPKEIISVDDTSDFLKNSFSQSNSEECDCIFVEKCDLPVDFDDSDSNDCDVIVKLTKNSDSFEIQKVKPRTMISVNKNLFPEEEMDSTKSKPRVLQPICKPQTEDRKQNVPFGRIRVASNLLEKVEKNVENSKASSLAYKRSVSIDFKNESPNKKSKTDFEEEVMNPRVVNFVTKIIKFVFSRPNFKCLFTAEEVLSLESFYDLPMPEFNFVCYKLFTRKPIWYNIYKFCDTIQLKLDTATINAMYECLKSNGFVITDYSVESVATLLDLLQSKDLKDLVKELRLNTKHNKQTNKASLIELLLKNSKCQSTLTPTKSSHDILKQKITNKLGKCIKLSNKFYDLFKKLHVLYSLGSSEFVKSHDLYQFMDLIASGEIVLPEYQLNDFPIFENAEDFHSFSKATEYQHEILNAIDTKNHQTVFELAREVHVNLQGILTQEIQRREPAHLNHFTAGYKYASALASAIKFLLPQHPSESKCWLECLLGQRHFYQGKRGIWYDQLALIHSKYFKNYNEAAKVVIEGLKDETVTEISAHDLSARGNNLKNVKKYMVDECYQELLSDLTKFPPDTDPFPSFVINARAVIGNETGQKRSYIDIQENGDKIIKSVEETAIDHYKQNGYTKAIHCEGTLLTNLLFLLFWDVIYESNVKLAFITEIQYLPLDFYSRDFYLNRKERIDARLSEISHDWSLSELHEFIYSSFVFNYHKKSLIISSLIEDVGDYLEIVDCIGRKQIASILLRLISGYSTYHSGLPDLFLWNPTEEKCCFVEVKGEKDKLSTKQKVWLNFLRSIDLNIQVCHVHTIGSKATEKIKKIQREQNL